MNSLTKGTLLRQGKIAILPSSQKQKQKLKKKKRADRKIFSKQKNKIKSQKKSPKEMQVSHLQNKEFKAMVIYKLTQLGRRIEELIENFETQKIQERINQN